MNKTIKKLVREHYKLSKKRAVIDKAYDKVAKRLIKMLGVNSDVKVGSLKTQVYSVHQHRMLGVPDVAKILGWSIVKLEDKGMTTHVSFPVVRTTKVHSKNKKKR